MEHILARPLVDILTEKLGVAIVMREENYIELVSKTLVSKTLVNKAIKIQKEESKKNEVQAKIKFATNLVSKKIQIEVENYNKINGTAFKDIHSCASYKDAQNYSHKDFCLSIWNWNVEVWEYVRSLDINSNLTADELIAALPKRT